MSIDPCAVAGKYSEKKVSFIFLSLLRSKMVEQVNITEDEAALYDRQIRLWGLDAQRRSNFTEI